jgi:hypothetical protein
MRRRVLFIGLSVMALMAPVGVKAQQKPTTCESRGDMDISPGFWREGNSGTFTTNGETGTVTCDGPVNGKTPTGPGTFGAAGRYGTNGPDKCDKAEGIFENSMTVPTAGGKENSKNKGTWSAGAFKGGGAFGGEFHGDTGDGTYEVTPKQGDCVSQPMTKIGYVIRWTQKG